MEENKAVSKNEYLNVQHNGAQTLALNLVPDLEGQLAIVHLDVIQRLAAMLPKSNFRDIKRRFIEALDMSMNLDEFISCLEAELKFQVSVNRIALIDTKELELPEQSVERTDH